MSIWKEKTGTWMYQFKFQGKKPGERGFRTRKEALQAQEDRKKEVKREAREGYNLLDGMKLYQEEMAKRIVKQTYEYKKYVLEGFLNHIGNISLKAVTVNQIISYLRKRPTNINYNRHRKEILSFFNYVQSWDSVLMNYPLRSMTAHLSFPVHSPCFWG